MTLILSVGEGEEERERSFICLVFIGHVRRVSDEFRYPSDMHPLYAKLLAFLSSPWKGLGTSRM